MWKMQRCYKIIADMIKHMQQKDTEVGTVKNTICEEEQISEVFGGHE